MAFPNMLKAKKRALKRYAKFFDVCSKEKVWCQLNSFTVILLRVLLYWFVLLKCTYPFENFKNVEKTFCGIIFNFKQRI